MHCPLVPSLWGPRSVPMSSRFLLGWEEMTLPFPALEVMQTETDLLATPACVPSPEPFFSLPRWRVTPGCDGGALSHSLRGLCFRVWPFTLLCEVCSGLCHTFHFNKP